MVLFIISMAVPPLMISTKSVACGSLCLIAQVEATSRSNRTLSINYFRTRINTELTGQKTFLVEVFWQKHVLPAMMLMADQLSATAVQQTMIIGTFFDAKHQMETQRTLQKIRAQAHKDYHPSTGVCEIGTNTKSLAASERKSELVAHVMSQRFQDRMLGNANTAGASGPLADKKARLKQFREKFCDPMDNGGSLYYLCEHDQNDKLSDSNVRTAAPGGIGAENPERMNKDLDFGRTIEYPWTLDVDFTDATLTNHEEEVMALADNIYGHEVFKRIGGGAIKPTTEEPFPAGIAAIMDARAMMAKLSVAKNSFNSITSMKAAGTAGSRDFMEAVLSELGVSSTPGSPSAVDDMRRLLGYSSATGNEIGPSYYAQMEVLTRKIYQNPDFYTNLYDKPANVERKKVAMQAIALMQKFDMFKSYLRNEANISILLELAVSDLQKRLEEKIKDDASEGVNPS